MQKQNVHKKIRSKKFKKGDTNMEQLQNNTNTSTYDQGSVLRSVTKGYIKSYAAQNKPLPSPHTVSEELLEAIAD